MKILGQYKECNYFVTKYNILVVFYKDILIYLDKMEEPDKKKVEKLIESKLRIGLT